jgi:hypothetical protein
MSFIDIYKDVLEGDLSKKEIMQVAAVFGVVVRGFMEQCQVLARLFMQII